MWSDQLLREPLSEQFWMSLSECIHAVHEHLAQTSEGMPPNAVIALDTGRALRFENGTPHCS